jgi:hypothetical protein
MYCANLRSLIRTMLRQEAQKYEAKDGLPIPQLAKAVVENLRLKVPSIDEWLEALYSLVYEEARSLFTRDQPDPGQYNLEFSFLIKSGVPRPHATLLVQIGEYGLPVPCEDGALRIKPLFGKERMNRAELCLAKAFKRKKGEETLAKCDLLDELEKLPGYYS